VPLASLAEPRLAMNVPMPPERDATIQWQKVLDRFMLPKEEAPSKDEALSKHRGPRDTPLTRSELSEELRGAAHHGDLSAVRDLLARGADPAERDGQGFVAIHYAATCPLDGDVVRHLCTCHDHRVSVNARNLYGVTALHLACISGNLEAARVLLAHGADPEAQEEKEGKTPLFCALMAGKTEWMVALLDDALEGGTPFNVNATVRDGTTLLMYAIQRPRAAFATVLALLVAGADRTADPYGAGNALSVAESLGLTAICTLLRSADGRELLRPHPGRRRASFC
jgi:ankyrin repeat protein